MAYELEAISAPMTPVSQPLPMREDRVITPYAPKAEVAVAPPATPPSQGAPKQDTISSAPADTEAQTEETVQLSPQIAALARKEQRFRQQQKQLEDERAAIAAEKAEISQLRAMKDKLAAKDYSGLEGLVDYNDYSQYQINKLNGTDPVQEELKALKAEISHLKKFDEDNVEKQFKAAVNERRTAATELITKSTDYPSIKRAGASEAVVQHIMDTWENDSVELSVEQAAKEVEEALKAQAREWAALLEEEKVAAPAEEKTPPPPLKSGLKTLTNQVTAGDVTRTAKSYQGMNDSERYAEARRRAEEKLQQQLRRS